MVGGYRQCRVYQTGADLRRSLSNAFYSTEQVVAVADNPILQVSLQSEPVECHLVGFSRPRPPTTRPRCVRRGTCASNPTKAASASNTTKPCLTESTCRASKSGAEVARPGWKFRQPPSLPTGQNPAAHIFLLHISSHHTRLEAHLPESGIRSPAHFPPSFLSEGYRSWLYCIGR
jgi:hypothetical protein